VCITEIKCRSSTVELDSRIVPMERAAPLAVESLQSSDSRMLHQEEDVEFRSLGARRFIPKITYSGMS
jgi:hypothetical protein